ncbi:MULTISPECIES: hypothetical protein [unclassified Pseudomonas]|uniref:hypothetical protein n=1 Tax=unclassified Pseudomonas TaxID=196821 RepID=UPI00287BF075|nr:hypothetical protein [Pseudomonas sp. HTZ1]MDS9592401.1 hypothetical protein [Pseudomonas sp. HTZ1]HBO6811521.1 hypothetical protein [Pseudomonas aeruginosa]
MFGLQHTEPNQGLFVPLYTHFLHKWNEPGHWEYDFDTTELVRRDAATGTEIERIPFGLQALASGYVEKRLPVAGQGA